MKEVALGKPSMAELPGYAAALNMGWSPDNVRTAEAARDHPEMIAEDAAGFVDSLDDQDAKGDPVRLADGSLAPRLPGFTRWTWDGEFCGSIGRQWQRGTCHIGFAIVPWKRCRAYAKQALALMLPEAEQRGLIHVDLTTDLANIASQKVILACGGRLMERFTRPAAYGDAEGLRFRIELANCGHAA